MACLSLPLSFSSLAVRKRAPRLGGGEGISISFPMKMLHIQQKAPERRIMASISVEPETKISFASNLALSTELLLLGVGVRIKRIAILNVKVYAVALYADSAILEKLSSFKGSNVAGNNDFFQIIATADVAKSIHIVLARDVEGQQFIDALNESLAPRLQKLEAGAEGESAAATLSEALKRRSLKKGTSIYLNWLPPAVLEISVADNASANSASSLVASIESKKFAESIFAVYLDTESVSESLKLSIAEGFQA